MKITLTIEVDNNNNLVISSSNEEVKVKDTQDIVQDIPQDKSTIKDKPITQSIIGEKLPKR